MRDAVAINRVPVSAVFRFRVSLWSAKLLFEFSTLIFINKVSQVKQQEGKSVPISKSTLLTLSF